MSDQFTEVSDAVYAQKVVGTWRARKFILGANIDVKCVYLSGGRASWSGTLTYLGQQTYLMYSGSWVEENGVFHTRIESSNVPQLIPVGMTSATKFISIDNQQWVYVDLSDGAHIIVKLPGDHEIRKGDALALRADPAKLHLFTADGQTLQAAPITSAKKRRA